MHGPCVVAHRRDGRRPEICRKYTLLAAQAQSITAQLTGPGPQAVEGESRAAVQEREAIWARSLSRMVALPSTGVTEQQQLIVGVLLRTLQEPALDQAQADLIAKLPAELAIPAVSRAADPTQMDTEGLETSMSAVNEAIERHDEIAGFALRRAMAHAGIEMEGDEDDDELFGGREDDVPTYDWRMRPHKAAVDVEMEGVESDAPQRSLQSLAGLLRDGRL